MFNLLKYILSFFLLYSVFISILGDGDGYPNFIRYTYLITNLILISLFLFTLIKFRDSYIKVINNLKSLFNRVTIFQILTFAMVIRLLWIFFSNNTQTSDFSSIIDMGKAIANGDYLFNIEKPTGTSILIALFLKFDFKNDIYFKIFLVGISLIQFYFIYKIFQTENIPKYLIKFGLLLLALWPEHWLYTNLIGSDILFSTIILFGFFIFKNFFPKTNLWVAFVLGVIFGSANWVRPTSLIFFLSVIFLLLLSKDVFLKRKIEIISISIAGYILINIPILIFNFNTLGIMSLSSSQQHGMNMLVGTNSKFKGEFNDEDAKLFDNLSGNNIVEKNKKAVQIAISRISSDLFAYFGLISKHKIGNLLGHTGGLVWSLNGLEKKYQFLIWFISDTFHKLILVLLSFVLFYGTVSRYLEKLIIISACFFISSHILFFECQGRYHHVLLPLFVLLLILSLNDYFSRISKKELLN